VATGCPFSDGRGYAGRPGASPSAGRVCRATESGTTRAEQTAHRCAAKPANVGGRRARDLFAVNELYRPLHPVFNQLEVSEATVHDRATDLVWQRLPSRYPVTFTDAFDLVAELNANSIGGCRHWRLPTVNELLTLLPEGRLRGVSPFRGAIVEVVVELRPPWQA
jgi:hypothetical protein